MLIIVYPQARGLQQAVQGLSSESDMSLFVFNMHPFVCGFLFEAGAGAGWTTGIPYL